MYRDAGNYKTHSFVIFGNPNRLPINTIEDAIRKKLIDETFFNPLTLKVPALIPESFQYDADLDHSWNEFDSLEITDEEITDDRIINELM